MQNNHQEHNYLSVLKDSLLKKKKVLENISKLNLRQKDILLAEKFDEMGFDVIYEEKGRFIAEINLLDSGFESVYDRVKKQITGSSELYKDEIRELQTLIGDVTDISMEVQVQEKRNHELMNSKSKEMKKEVQTARATNKAAFGYYQSMNKLNIVDPQFMDRKK
ncbi:MAG: flagellar protein FliT [Clostridiales bacterium]|nr:flagellar protein FliT [Clostridiales bacterium]